MIARLTTADIGKWVTHTDGTGSEERGKVRSFENSRRVAWVVYSCDKNWDTDHWKDYTAACTHYNDLTLTT